MTEKELKQLCHLKRESERLQRELQEFEEELSHYDGYKGNQLSHTPKGCGIDLYDKLTEILDGKRTLKDAISVNLARIQCERCKLEYFIGGIEDAQIRLIFRLRHMHCMTWEDIGEELNYSEGRIRQLYKDYLKKITEITV